MEVEPDAPIDVENQLVTAAEREKYLGMAMLCSVNHSRFCEIISGLKNYPVKGNDKYPSDMTEAYNILNHYIRDTKWGGVPVHSTYFYEAVGGST